jgi:hypothetical protein
MAAAPGEGRLIADDIPAEVFGPDRCLLTARPDARAIRSAVERLTSSRSAAHAHSAT